MYTRVVRSGLAPAWRTLQSARAPRGGTMETPASISNSAAAATLIQRAFRGAQKRIAAEQAELAHVLNALEEADEARINARESVMTQVNKKLEDFIANVGSSLRGGGETALSKSALHAKSLQKKELPSLTVGSLHNFVAGLENNERVAMVDALAILQAATVMFMSEPSVCDITVPEGGKCTIVGDLHGQLDDLLHLLRKLGMPSSTNMYVFNGDLVDRGDHSCEIVLLIFALKLSHPDAVFVNRGNHEEPHINIYSGFEEECVAKYDHRVFQTFHQAFVWLPYACLVNEKTLVLHAGLPADSKNVTLDDIRDIARGPDVCSEEANWGKERWIRDLTWSDPHPDPNFQGVEKSARGAGVLWGEDVTREFFARNGLSALVRSHQCVEAGVDVAHGERVYTVFSASNYCGMSGNLGAVLIQRHGCDKPTETYQWDPREDAKMSAPVVSKRKSKEMRKAAAITQATEYIIEHRAALLEYFKQCDGKRTGAVSFHTWAKGLSQVLQVRLAWSRLVGGLVGPADMDDSCDGVLYEKWLGNFEVELKGGCKEWQHEVVGKISAAVFQNGGDLARAFAEMDADGSGEISPEEFRAAVRKRLPSLAVLSDAQLEAVVKAFDADGSGQVDVAEFEHLLNEHMAIASSRGAGGDDDVENAAASVAEGENAEPSDSEPSDSEPSVREPTLRDTRNVIGIQWDTSFGRKAKATMADHMERTLADAIAHLFYTHRRELFHVWHATFDPDGTGSIAKDAFIASVRALDAAGGAQMLSEDALRRLAETLDSNGDGRIDFAEFSGNIGRIVERVHGTR